MAKRKREITRSKIERLIREGRGQGTGNEYLPWLRIQDVPSSGRASRLVGWTTGRMHELLSDIERDYLYLLDYSDEVSDIREQYPLLPMEETQMIAERLGIEHPKDPKTGVPIVMTTDFLITFKDRDVARTVKSFTELEDERTIEKFEIERLYWEAHHIDWGIVTDRAIPDTLIRNIEWIHKEYYNEDVTELSAFAVHNLQNLLSSKLLSGETIRSACLSCDDQLGLEIGSSLVIFRHLLARKIWFVNMNNRITPTLSVNGFVVNSSVDRLAKGG